MAGPTINHLNLVVSDVLRSVKFYTENLGFTYVRYLNPRKAILSYGGFDFFLEQAENVSPHPRFHFGILAEKDEVYRMIDRLRARSVKIVAGNNPNNLADVYVADRVRFVFYFEDPDGYLVEVYSHIGIA
ncbi:VOC family protein [Sinorhizobium meliloti]|uniref:VOC family protein n=1 Tax=Rhizobium meliloti TaxID=382 RepID=UPI000FDCB466|nr:VOC family protein [Sinorhizobium meliloti]MDX0135215.1 hypothetical protein [Sinorhizobium meliloti]RVK41416.1 hypothetical protein CN163_06815 [Sinorhizobium meliloti]